MRIRGVLAVLWVAVCFAPAACIAQTVVADPGGYDAVYTVADTSEAARLQAFRRGASSVFMNLVRDMMHQEKGEKLAERAAELVASYSYEPAASGTGQRLRVQFDPTKFDAAIHDQGVKKWSEGGRGIVLIWVGVNDGRKHQYISTDDPAQAEMRKKIQELALQHRLLIVLPPKDQPFVRSTRNGWSAKEDADWSKATKQFGATDDFDIRLRAMGKKHWRVDWVLGSPEEAGTKKSKTFDEAIDYALGRLDWALMMHPTL